MIQSNYVDIMKKKFAERQLKNPKYSLRSFSQHLGLDPGSLSSILRGRRPLSPLHAHQVISRLKLSELERKQFYLSLLFKQKLPQDILSHETRHHVEEAQHFCILSEWEYAATLCLASIHKFQLTPSTLSSTLKITLKRSKQVLSTLKSSGFLKDQDGFLRPVQQKFSTTEDTLSLALQHSHLISLKMAKRSLKKLKVHQRDFSSLTLAVKSQQLNQMKALIRQFRKQFEAKFDSQDGDVIVQLNLQLFPVSEKIDGKPQLLSRSNK